MQTQQQPIVKETRLESFANPPPPPAIAEPPQERELFQTMEDLRRRHGQTKGRGERILHTTGAVLACLVLTSLLYVAILFME